MGSADGVFCQQTLCPFFVCDTARNKDNHDTKEMVQRAATEDKVNKKETAKTSFAVGIGIWYQTIKLLPVGAGLLALAGGRNAQLLAVFRDSAAGNWEVLLSQKLR